MGWAEGALWAPALLAMVVSDNVPCLNDRVV
jgi:hypothetical protein